MALFQFFYKTFGHGEEPYQPGGDRAATPPSKDTETESQTQARLKREWKRLIVISLGVIVVVVVGVVGGIVGSSANMRYKPVHVTLPTPTSSTTELNLTPAATSDASWGAATSTPAGMIGSATSDSKHYYPAPVSWGYPHLEVLTTTKSLSPYYIHRGMNSSDPLSWSAWENPFGGAIAPFEYSISAVASLGRVDIFVTGTNSYNSAYHSWHGQNVSSANDSIISHWEGIGGACITAPSAVSWGSGRLDVFVLGTDSSVYAQYRATSASSWSGWFKAFSGAWDSYSPTAVSWGPSRIDLFMVDPNTKQLYHAYFDGRAWKPASGLYGFCVGRPIAVSSKPGRIDVFVRGGDSGLWRISYSNGGWSTWSSISDGVGIHDEPDAISWGPDRVDVFAWGVDDDLLHKSFDGASNTWSPAKGFEILESGLGGPPKAVSDASGSLHVFAYSKLGSLLHLSWNETEGRWSPTPLGSNKPGSSSEQLGMPPGRI